MQRGYVVSEDPSPGELSRMYARHETRLDRCVSKEEHELSLALRDQRIIDLQTDLAAVLAKADKRTERWLAVIAVVIALVGTVAQIKGVG